MSQNTSQASPVERVLASLSLSIIALAVLSFVATLIAGIAGASREALATGFWPVVVWVSYVGLPVGFVLIIALLLLSRRRRLRDLKNEK